MDTVKLKINGIEVECPANSTILEAARQAGKEELEAMYGGRRAENSFYL